MPCRVWLLQKLLNKTPISSFTFVKLAEERQKKMAKREEERRELAQTQEELQTKTMTMQKMSEVRVPQASTGEEGRLLPANIFLGCP